MRRFYYVYTTSLATLLPPTNDPHTLFFPIAKRVYHATEVQAHIDDYVHSKLSPARVFTTNEAIDVTQKDVLEHFAIETDQQLDFVKKTITKVIHLRYEMTTQEVCTTREQTMLADEPLCLSPTRVLHSSNQNLNAMGDDDDQAMGTVALPEDSAAGKRSSSLIVGVDAGVNRNLSIHLDLRQRLLHLQSEEWEFEKQKHRERTELEKHNLENELKLEKLRQTIETQKRTQLISMQGQYQTATRLVERMVTDGVHDDAALQMVHLSVPQLSDAKMPSPLVMKEVRWMVTQLIDRGVLKNPSYIQLGMQGSTNKDWRQTFWGLCGTSDISQATIVSPTLKRLRHDEDSQHDISDEVRRVYQAQSLHDPYGFCGIHAVLQLKLHGDGDVALFCQLARTLCPRKVKLPRHSATCMQKGHKLVEFAQESRDSNTVRDLLEQSGWCLSGIFASCVLGVKTTATVTKSIRGITIDLRNNPTVVNMVEQADPQLLSFVMKYLVVCGTGYTDYVTPFHHLQQGPDHMTLQTLQYYVQHIEMNNEAGVQCVLKMPGLADVGLGMFCTSSRLKHAVEWQHSLLVQAGHHHLPWALGYMQQNMHGKVFNVPYNSGMSALSLQALFDHRTPSVVYREQNENGWWLSKETYAGYGIICADPYGDPKFAYVHRRNWSDSRTEETQSPSEILPPGLCNLPETVETLRELASTVSGTPMDHWSLSSMSDAQRRIQEARDQPNDHCAAYLQLAKFDIRNGHWRYLPEGVRDKMFDVYRDLVRLGQRYA